MSSVGPTPDKMLLKQTTREVIAQVFKDRGCSVENKRAGAVKYSPISIKGSDQRCAAIYGSKGGAASLWIKEEAWLRLKPKMNRRTARVEDVDLFGRGFQWAVHFDDPDDPTIVVAAEIAMEVGRERWERAKTRRANDARRKKARILREAEIAKRKRDPFA